MAHHKHWNLMMKKRASRRALKRYTVKYRPYISRCSERSRPTVQRPLIWCSHHSSISDMCCEKAASRIRIDSNPWSASSPRSDRIVLRFLPGSVSGMITEVQSCCTFGLCVTNLPTLRPSNPISFSILLTREFNIKSIAMWHLRVIWSDIIPHHMFDLLVV